MEKKNFTLSRTSFLLPDTKPKTKVPLVVSLTYFVVDDNPSDLKFLSSCHCYERASHICMMCPFCGFFLVSILPPPFSLSLAILTPSHSSPNHMFCLFAFFYLSNLMSYIFQFLLPLPQIAASAPILTTTFVDFEFTVVSQVD